MEAQTKSLATMPGGIPRMRSLERSMERVRWFGIALGIYQVFWYETLPGRRAPGSTKPIAVAGLALLLLLNVAVRLVLRRPRAEPTLARLGVIAFLCDIAAVWTIVWAYNFEEFGTTWVLLTILCLEGALRYALRGALVPIVIAAPVESVREFFHATSFPYFTHLSVTSHVSSVTFRVGFMLMVAAVAGVMARNLERRRAEAEVRAGQLEELAERETAARRESNAFQKVILAGVSASGLQETLQSMVEHVANDLGYERICVMMQGEDGKLHLVAAQGFASDLRNDVIPLGQGIAGKVPLTGRIEVVPDVSRDPRYIAVDPSTRSQISVPIKSGEHIPGVLHIESGALNAFGPSDVSRLERLSAQMALIIENARLLASERATVERLQELDVMKSDFIAIASHELRTPLTAMQGSIKTLRRPDLPLPKEQIAELLTILDRQSDRLTRLVEDLLIVSRIDAGGFTLRMEETILGPLLAEIIEDLGRGASRVSLAIPPSVPAVVTDRQRFGQIVRNLIENALKFSADGSTVRLTVHYDKQTLMVEVADEGPGIPEGELPHIFERFHQVGGSMRRRSEGFGLGLYITKRLTEALGGSIEAHSEMGTGSTFRVWLPAPTTQDRPSEIA